MINGSHLLLSCVMGSLVANPAIACNPDWFKKNGLYYSASGKPSSAVRIRTDLIKDYKSNPNSAPLEVKLALQGTPQTKYRYGGKFFVRSGVGGTPWVIEDRVTLTDDALLVRQFTHSELKEKSEFVAVFRETMAPNVCRQLNREQIGTGKDAKFVKERAYISTHAGRNAAFDKDPFLTSFFHFQFNDGKRDCRSTARVTRFNPDTKSNNNLVKDVTSTFYNNIESSNVKIPPSNADQFIAGAVETISRLTLPAPAYAAPRSATRSILGNENDPVASLSSINVSLHYLPASKDTCVSFPAPVPTIRSQSFWNFLKSEDGHAKAARKLARDGWKPIVTDIVLNPMISGRPSLLRINWAN